MLARPAVLACEAVARQILGAGAKNGEAVRLVGPYAIDDGGDAQRVAVDAVDDDALGRSAVEGASEGAVWGRVPVLPCA